MKRIIALTAILALLAGCGLKPTEPTEPESPSAPPPAVADQTGAERDLMAGIEAEEPDVQADVDGQTATAMTDFGLKLFQSCLDGENTLVSPLSVLSALAMTANGAAGQTLAQFEDVFGADLESLNAWLYAYVKALPDAEGSRVHVANGIWLNADGGLSVEPDFLKTNGTYYGAGIYEDPFDGELAEKVNAWVREHTAGRIERILDAAPAGAMAYLVNALSFDGIWEDIYREDQIRPDTFTAQDGSERQVPFMWSTEQAFLQDEHAKGFIKYYKGRQLAFAALLPEEGMTVEEYAATLSGGALRKLLAEAGTDMPVVAAIPKFSAQYGAELEQILAEMGLADAFDPDRADFSRMGSSQTGNLYVDRVLHKSFINVDEKGTQAGAATAVEVRMAAAPGLEEQVVLNRPFVYMLIDCQANAPLFIGAVTDILP